MWERVVGQDRAVALLRHAAERPVHAYLLAGPRGSGVEDAARCFAAALVDPAGSPDVTNRVLRSRHPDVVEFESEGVAFRIKEDVRERIIPEANRSPIEGDRKVLMILDAERLRDDAANALLKTIEEPPASTVILLLTPSPEDLLATVRSRCQRVDLDALTDAEVRAALATDGLTGDRAELIVRLAGGRVDRAARFAGRIGPLRDAFVTTVARLDGTGAGAIRGAEDVGVALGEAVASIGSAQAEANAELESDIERNGYPDRAAQGLRTRLKRRHEREARRARLDALGEGLTAIESMYRDALAPTDQARNIDRERITVAPRDAARALDAVAEARRGLEHNPNETLLLERLFLQLPAAR